MAYRILSPEEQNQDMSSDFALAWQGSSSGVYQRSQMQLISNFYGEEPHHVVEVLFKAWPKQSTLPAHDPRIQDQTCQIGKL